jgi:hypothetical protein
MAIPTIIMPGSKGNRASVSEETHCTYLYKEILIAERLVCKVWFSPSDAELELSRAFRPVHHRPQVNLLSERGLVHPG